MWVEWSFIRLKLVLCVLVMVWWKLLMIFGIFFSLSVCGMDVLIWIVWLFLLCREVCVFVLSVEGAIGVWLLGCRLVWEMCLVCYSCMVIWLFLVWMLVVIFFYVVICFGLWMLGVFVYFFVWVEICVVLLIIKLVLVCWW